MITETLRALRPLRIVFFLGAMASSLSTAACAADATGDGSSQSTEALASGGGGGGAGVVGGHCSGGFCTCTGDEDCNDMYSGGECANAGICQINDQGVPRCRCTAAAQTAPPPKVSPIGGIGKFGGIVAKAN